LVAQYPEESERNAVLESFGGSVKPSQDEIERILRIEFAEFKKLGRDVILQVLEKNKWSYVECFGELISKLETKEHQQRRAECILLDIQSTLTPEQIQRAIDENNGDTDKTAAQLLQKGRSEEEKERDKTLEALVLRFRDIKVNKILDALKESNFNVQMALPKIVKLRRENLVVNFLKEFPTLTREQVYYAIEANDDNSYSKTRANLEALLTNTTNPQKGFIEELEQSRIVEIADLVKQDVVNPQQQDGVEQNFGTVFDKFLRDGPVSPGNAQEKGIPENTENFASRIDRSVIKPEDPCSIDVHTDIRTKSVVKLYVPERVDFGEPIVVKWENTDEATNCDWIAMYAEGSSQRDYLTYHYVTPAINSVVFYAPNSCAHDIYFAYYPNKTYNLRAESSVVKIGPKYTLSVLSCLESDKSNEKYTVSLQVNQDSGKEFPYLWLGCYLENERNLKSFISFQYCKAGQTIVFGIPKSGAWSFKLFPFKSFEPILSLPYFIEGEDKLQLSVIDGQFKVVFNIKTLDISNSKPWIGIYESSATEVRQWSRYTYIGSSYNGECLIAATVPSGTYQARLLDYYTSYVAAKSNIVQVGGF